MGHAADFSHAQSKAGFVAAVVVADQLAFPVSQEVAGILARATRAEVVYHCLSIGSRGRRIGPNVGAMSFLRAWRKHLDKRSAAAPHQRLQ